MLAFDGASELVDAEMEAAFHNLAHTLEQQGIDFSNYLQITGQSEQQFVDELKQRSERNLRTRILLDSVVAIEGLELADGELDDAVATMGAAALILQMPIPLLPLLVVIALTASSNVAFGCGNTGLLNV